MLPCVLFLVGNMSFVVILGCHISALIDITKISKDLSCDGCERIS